MALDPTRREPLYRAKLTALVKAHGGAGPDATGLAPVDFPGGAGVVAGTGLWVLAEENPVRSLGPALVVALRESMSRLDQVVADGEAAGVVARRAQQFDYPIGVWRVAGTQIEPAAAEPLTEQPALHPLAERYLRWFTNVGAEAVCEAGILRAEVLGLEVARVEVDSDGAAAVLAVGVGKHDREARRMLHGDAQGYDELAGAVRQVRQHRVPGAVGSPAYQLAPERWLRSVVVARPDLVSAAHLEPVAPVQEREDLRMRGAAPAVGTDLEGRNVVVVCSVGIDLDLVPTAVDEWLAHRRDEETSLVLCVPEGDDHRVLHEQGSLLRWKAKVRAAPRNWREAV